jgi:hypothetical protein
MRRIVNWNAWHTRDGDGDVWALTLPAKCLLALPGQDSDRAGQGRDSDASAGNATPGHVARVCVLRQLTLGATRAWAVKIGFICISYDTVLYCTCNFKL